ncbi:hypothetical protein SCHPADRAFT_894089 [Schizopora paradoxa]|uniref:Uncharacterized protein n=1 Tax=Schizopora paradoxa TaxID=27342 RepID=A0A0H2RTM0_9AGAM|nr:hypothetical protein SCHPADRAFT_894089 [Schizopora paradoxa]
MFAFKGLLAIASLFYIASATLAHAGAAELTKKDVNPALSCWDFVEWKPPNACARFATAWIEYGSNCETEQTHRSLCETAKIGNVLRVNILDIDVEVFIISFAVANALSKSSKVSKVVRTLDDYVFSKTVIKSTAFLGFRGHN